MYINLLTDNPNSWIIPYVNDLKVKLNKNHKVNHIFNYKHIQKGDILFILSCEKIIPNKYLKFHKHNIIIHPTLKLNETERFACQGHSIWSICIPLSHFCSENFPNFFTFILGGQFLLPLRANNGKREFIQL